MAVLLSIGQFYSEGAVTWPDSMMRKADGYVRSVFQELPSFGEKERKSAIARPYTELPKREPADKGVTEEDYPTPDIPYGAVEHRVKRIVDGDTVYLKDGTKVRLHGIDTPERDQPYGKQATRNLDKLIGHTVFVVERDTDRYGRLVGTLYTPEGVNVNLEMVCTAQLGGTAATPGTTGPWLAVRMMPRKPDWASGLMMTPCRLGIGEGGSLKSQLPVFK